MNKTQEEIKQEVEEGKIRKVQISRYIERKSDETNEYYHIEISKAIKALLPYYEYVIGALNIMDLNDVELKCNNYDKNMILYGPPGTGKTYNTAIYAVAICEGKSVDIVGTEPYSEILKRYSQFKKEGRIAFTTFHQSYGYEEFIEGIKPVLNDSSANIGYEVVSGVFKRFCENAKNTYTLQEKEDAYVFIIDEINRGNISKIFGELITLIEDTKREGMEEQVTAILPYSGEEFSVPQNVYIIGTMNSADRSIALMDTALRRRFKFKEIMPNHNLLKGVTVEDGGECVDIELMLKIINERIILLYDHEHTLGHAFFMSLKKDNSINNLAAIFEKSVIPLLQEYFYEDYEKIRLVLGDNAKKDRDCMFVIAEDTTEDIFEGDISDEIDIPEKTYTIQYNNFTNIKAYKGISSKL